MNNIRTSLQYKGFLFSLDRSSPHFPTYLRVNCKKKIRRSIHTIRIQISRNRHRATMVIYSIVGGGILMIFRSKKHLSLDLHFKISKLKTILSYVELKTIFEVCLATLPGLLQKNYLFLNTFSSIWNEFPLTILDYSLISRYLYTKSNHHWRIAKSFLLLFRTACVV